MKQLHSGWDYKLYKIYLWGGLPLLVIFILVSVLVFDATSLPGPQAFLTIIGPVMLWFGGIVLYWWWVFLFKGNIELQELAQTQGQAQEIPGIPALKSWNTLHQAMALNGGDVQALIENAKKANRPIIVWYGSLNLLVLWIFCPVTLGSFGIIPSNKTTLGIWVGGVIVWVIAMLVGTPAMLSWGTKSAGDAYLAPLGLAVTRTPGLTVDVIGLLMGGGQRLIPDGPAIVEGERYGRLVHIETIDKHSLTVLQARLPEFIVQSNDGKLTPDEDAPGEAVKALDSLRKAKRWKGITVHSGPEGIGVQRESKGTNMWLYDLWLVEYLADRLNG